MNGFGCRVLAYDVKENRGLMKEGIQYVSLEDLSKPRKRFLEEDEVALFRSL
jgi:hypothetical protein